MKKNRQSGFALLEVILVFVLIAVISVTGWYIWNAKKQTEVDLKPTTSSVESAKPAEKTDTTTASWLPYTPPKGEYTIRLADGWKMERYQDSSSLYAFDTANVTYQKGTKATVKAVEGGRDGSSIGLFINYFDTIADASGKIQGTLVEPLETTQKVAVKKYTYTETEDNDSSIGGLPKGGKLFTYSFEKNGHSVLIIYGIGPEDADQHETVEKAVKSFKFLK